MGEGSEHKEQAESGKVQRSVLATMSKRYWIVVAIFVGLALLGLIFSVVHYYSYNASERQKASSAREYATKEQVICAELEAILRPECILKEIKTAEENKQSAEDLRAQQEMSVWAYSLLLVSILALLVSGVGIFLIYKTLVATQQAARYAADTLKQAQDATEAAKDTAFQTKRIGDQQLRARLSISNLDAAPKFGYDGGSFSNFYSGIEVTIEGTNAGILPATDIEGSVRMLIHLAGKEAELLDQVDFEYFDIPGNRPTLIVDKMVIRAPRRISRLQDTERFLICGEISYNPSLVTSDRQTKEALVKEYVRFCYAYVWLDENKGFVRKRIPNTVC